MIDNIPHPTQPGTVDLVPPAEVVPAPRVQDVPTPAIMLDHPWPDRQVWLPRRLAGRESVQHQLTVSAYQLILTATGPKPAIHLLDQSEVVLTYVPSLPRYAAVRAHGVCLETSKTIELTTDKGIFQLPTEQSLMLSSGAPRRVTELREGDSLLQCKTRPQNGYLRVSLRDGQKGKRQLHQMVAEDVLGKELDFPHVVVHHSDGDKMNNDPSNLTFISQSEHATHHGQQLAKFEQHVFQRFRFGKSGHDNPMHRNAPFWQDPTKVYKYKEKQRQHMHRRGEAPEMAKQSNKQQMINLALNLLSAGYEIDTFEKYEYARKKVNGRLPSKAEVQRSIERRFGSYDNFFRAVRAQNHKVISIRDLKTLQFAVGLSLEPAEHLPMAADARNVVIWPDRKLDQAGVVTAGVTGT